MASEEPTVAAESPPEPESAEPAEDNPPAKTGKSKKATKEPKAKKAAAPRKPRSPPSHPPYVEVLIRIQMLRLLIVIFYFIEFFILGLDLIVNLVVFCR